MKLEDDLLEALQKSYLQRNEQDFLANAYKWGIYLSKQKPAIISYEELIDNWVSFAYSKFEFNWFIKGLKEATRGFHKIVRDKTRELLLSLYELSSGFANVTNLDYALEHTLLTVQRIMGAERIGIMLWDEKKKKLELKKSIGPDSLPFGVKELGWGEGVAGFALASGKACIVNDTSKDEIFVPSPPGQVEVKSLAAFPLIVKDKKIGTLNIGTITRYHTFTEDEIKALEVIAGRTALIIENVSLREKEKEYLEELQNRQEKLTATISYLRQLNSAITHSLLGLEVEERLKILLSMVLPFFKVRLGGVVRLKENTFLFSKITGEEVNFVPEITHKLYNLNIPRFFYVKELILPPFPKGIGKIFICPIQSNLKEKLFLLIGAKEIQKEDKEKLFLLVKALEVLLENVVLYSQAVYEREKISAILQNLREGVICILDDHTIISFNKASERILNISQEEVIGKNIEELFPWLLPAFPLGRDTSHWEKEVIEGNSKRFFELSYNPVEESYRAFKGGIIVIRDITQRKKMEELRNDFISTVSHDLRSPLTTLKGYIDILLYHERKLSLDKKVEVLQIMREELERLIRLINNVLDLTRFEADMVELVPSSINIPELVDKLIAPYRYTYRKYKFILNFSSDFPPIIADAGLIEQLLSNLIFNAIKYSPSGGEIEIGGSPVNEEKVKVYIKDSGLGIPQGELPNIFNKFYRVSSHKEMGIGGTGLGLFIVKNIIEVHKGDIKVESKFKEGTVFSFTLPKKFKGE